MDTDGLNALLNRMALDHVAYGERAGILAAAMIEYEKTAVASEEIIVRGWSLVYYFREEPELLWDFDAPRVLWSRRGIPFRDRVVRDHRAGRLGLQPPGSMTKPALRPPRR
jgi:hypothetical protein